MMAAGAKRILTMKDNSFFYCTNQDGIPKSAPSTSTTLQNLVDHLQLVYSQKSLSQM